MSAVPSPCIGVCQLDPKSGLCIGCLRTVEEIEAWSNASELLRRAILRALVERRANSDLLQAMQNNEGGSV
ncbi:MAG: DUF1289 domain-containing protein [Betaproteobacteria bacterium]|nr:DUF1289 domain-containing protein [Betaproteobacteria bacterium]